MDDFFARLLVVASWVSHSETRPLAIVLYCVDAYAEPGGTGVPPAAVGTSALVSLAFRRAGHRECEAPWSGARGGDRTQPAAVVRFAGFWLRTPAQVDNLEYALVGEMGSHVAAVALWSATRRSGT